MRNLTLRDPSYMGALSVAPPPLGLSLRFADTKSLIDLVSGQNLITYSRTSNGTFIDSLGVLQTATANQPRFTHDPLTLQSLGLLVEEQRTNVCLYSEEFDIWNINSGTTVTANATANPAGTTTADKIVETAANIAHYRGRFNVLAANTTCTLSVYVKAGERNFAGLQLTPNGTDYIYCTFNIQTGVASTPVNAGNGSGATASIQAINNGWYRCVLTGIPSSTAANPLCAIYVGNANVNLVTSPYLGDGTSGIYLWGAQLEAGAFPTSYIPTTTAAATRSADVASITGTNFSSWYRQDEGTVFADARSIASAGSERFPLIIQGATFNDRWVVGVATTNQYQTFYALGGAAQANLTVGSLTDSSVFRLASTAKINDIAMSANGSAVQLGASASLITASQIGIGRAAQYLNGTIRRIDYWPQRLPDSMLRALTL